MFLNLRQYLETLRKEKDLVVIEVPVDPYLELAEIHRRVIEEEGPALLFTQVKGKSFPVVTNLFGTMRRVERAIGTKPEEMVRGLVQLLPELMPPKLSKIWEKRSLLFQFTRFGTKKVERQTAPLLAIEEADFDLGTLPALTGWPLDGGPFFTLPLVYTEHPTTREHNLGMYRMQIKGRNKTGIHWQIHKGGGFHHFEAEKRKEALPVTIFLGGPPALIVSAVAPLPEPVPELLFASFLMGEKLPLVKVEGHPHPLIAEAEFAFLGEVPAGIREPEGPFGDHYGYYSLTHDFPVFNLKKVYRRKGAIYPATVVGKPRQEDYYIGEYLQQLLSPLFPLVMPGVKELWTYAETGFHSLAGAIVRESYSREALSHAFRILGEGQLTLTKFLMVTDAPVSLRNFPQFLEAILARFRPERDLIILPHTSMDTLDYTGRTFNHGSKAIMLGIGEEIQSLPETYTEGDLAGVEKISVFCRGTLLLSGKSYEEDEGLPTRITAGLHGRDFPWPLLILVDDVEEITDQTSFLWTVFTRFDPAHDLYGNKEIVGNHIAFHGPILIDARMKPFYPDELIPDPETVTLVDKRWREYFPEGI
ncbi:4-hydroxybenzoate decarboxylase subunit C [[Clostridium] ultunense Esp]|uniref:UbiD family decarboxylase n=1 Tax=Thermicanus aegyptius TaxID=94009 RepID=UPI0002B704B6|nr:UbiD family decarboxylase [Thermicanus aegyptius]CCQ95492.1 4-hydroxybenzoate decarboxylase subunit C [[Clostridium] ultunense Esp]